MTIRLDNLVNGPNVVHEITTFFGFPQTDADGRVMELPAGPDSIVLSDGAPRVMHSGDG